jgi:type IV secretory pathway TraG/TraD family ATPase VirD4
VFSPIFVSSEIAQSAPGSTMYSIRFTVLQAALALLIVVTALFVSTQWAAHMLGNQPELGEPWLHVLGLKIYAPWKLFVWWIEYDTQATLSYLRTEIPRQ